MARTNVEDRLYIDSRFTRLCIKLGNRHQALGACVDAFRLAQDYWFPGRRPIPLHVWERQGMENALIEVGFAEKKEDGIYISGSETQFAWLFKSQSGGKKSGLEIIEQSTRVGSSGLKGTRPLTLTHSPTQKEKNTYMSSQAIEPTGSHPTGVGMDHPLVELWNTEANARLPRVRSVGRKRARQLAAAWKEFGREHWLAAITAANGLPFYNGVNDRNWKMDFDYFIREGKSTKLIEQFESNKPQQQQLEENPYDGKAEIKDF